MHRYIFCPSLGFFLFPLLFSFSSHLCEGRKAKSFFYFSFHFLLIQFSLTTWCGFIFAFFLYIHTQTAKKPKLPSFFYFLLFFILENFVHYAFTTSFGSPFPGLHCPGFGRAHAEALVQGGTKSQPQLHWKRWIEGSGKGLPQVRYGDAPELEGCC